MNKRVKKKKIELFFTRNICAEKISRSVPGSMNSRNILKKGGKNVELRELVT